MNTTTKPGPLEVRLSDQLGHMWPERKGVTMNMEPRHMHAELESEAWDRAQAMADKGRNMYFEGQHGEEDEDDTATRLALVAERDALRLMVQWAYGKLHSRTFNSMDDALELDRMKLYCEHGAVA